MTTEQQITANQHNALLSTGATTDEGKAIVSKNAVKHGVFTNDLIISNGDGKENIEEFNELLNGLIESLNPSGQMEHLLAEKIAVDFWRLKRVLRFETGSVRKYLDIVVDEYYGAKEWDGTKIHKTNEELDEEIAELQVGIDFGLAYKEALLKGDVNFNSSIWSNNNIEIDIVKELYRVIEPVKSRLLTDKESELYDRDELTFEQLKEIVSRANYADSDIAEILIEELEKGLRNGEKKIENLRKQKLKNQLTEEIIVGLNSLPKTEETEKIMRYEHSLQKSIMQNLIMLKQIHLSK